MKYADIKETASALCATGNEPEYYPTEDEITEAVRGLIARAYEEAARVAENPYGDEVQAFGRDEPKTVGEKIAAVIRSLQPSPAPTEGAEGSK